jgi:hypothetical protein
VLTPALWQVYVDIFAKAGIEVYEGMAAVLVEEQAPPDAGSILNMRELQEQMDSQLHAVHDVLAAGRERENIVTGYMKIVRSVLEPVLGETDRANYKNGNYLK